MKTVITSSLLAICLIAYPVCATEIPGGYVSGDWYSSGNPYNINGEITVHTDSTLNIHEGVEVIFQGHYKSIVNGFMEAVGTETDSILFTAADTSEGWHSIRFIDAPDSSHLSYCIIQYGQASGTEPDNLGGGIYCNTSNPVIRHCTVRWNSADYGGAGMCFEYNSNPTISHCVVGENSAANVGGCSGGIDCYEGSSPIIESCTISGNWVNWRAGGIGCAYSSNPTISHCVITGNTASTDEGGGIGIY